MDADERFQRALDDALAGKPAGEVGLTAEDREAIALACRLASRPPAPPARWRASLRQTLLAGQQAPSPRRSLAGALRAVGAFALLLVLAGGLSWVFSRLRPQPGGLLPPQAQPTLAGSYPEKTLTPDPAATQPGEAIPPTWTPAPPSEPQATQPGPQPILYTVQPGDTLAKIAEQTGISVAWLVEWNGLKVDGSDLEAGRQLVVGYDSQASGRVGPGTPAHEIGTRLVFPTWTSLWVQGILTLTQQDGTQQYAYVQAWLSRDGRGRVLSSDYLPETPQASPDTPVRWVAVSDGERRVLKDLQTGETSDLPTRQDDPGAYQWVEHPLETASPLVEMLFPWRYGLLSSTPEVVGEEYPANRPAVVVKWLGETIWVDEETGVILRRVQKVTSETSQVAQVDAGLTQIAYNLPLPETVTRTDDLDAARFEAPPQPAETPPPTGPADADCRSFPGGDAQQAANFLILAPHPVPEDLPLQSATVCTYTNGLEEASLTYGLPSDDPHSGNKLIILTESHPGDPVTPESLAHLFRRQALDIHPAEVRGTTGYLYWSPAASAGSSAWLEWNEGEMAYRIALFGDWPQPDEANPRRLDGLLLDIANALVPPWPAATPTP